jgi:hypothetical protein
VIAHLPREFAAEFSDSEDLSDTSVEAMFYDAAHSRFDANAVVALNCYALERFP